MSPQTKQRKTSQAEAPQQSQAPQASDAPPVNDESGLSPALSRLVRDPRVNVRRGGAPASQGRTVVYWMQRAERGVDNHALNCAVAVANELKLPLVVFFAGISNFPHANLRHYAFLNQGLADIDDDLRARNISFVLRRAPHESHERLLQDAQAAICIGDENPMREPERWRRTLAERLRIPFWTVDADVIVPSKLFPKAQYAAYTLRPRLMKLVPQFLTPFDNPYAHVAWQRPKNFLADDPRADITAGWTHLDRSVGPVPEWTGGSHAALSRLRRFTGSMLRDYPERRAHPELDGTSALSPYLHFGHIGPQTIALAVAKAAADDSTLAAARAKYFDELITWRELSVNFVRYTPSYDTVACAEPWASKTIAEHAGDRRDRVYPLARLEAADTYDELWNAAQRQMNRHGWMHNILRMYWAKKIVEWTPDVEAAMHVAVTLNDRYFLDGRDPNGYSGVAWAVLGKFDRPWGTRPIFGKRRYMSGASTGRKFDSAAYMRTWAK